MSTNHSEQSDEKSSAYIVDDIDMEHTQYPIFSRTTSSNNRQYYRYKPFPNKIASFHIEFDRILLHALFDE